MQAQQTRDQIQSQIDSTVAAGQQPTAAQQTALANATTAADNAATNSRIQQNAATNTQVVAAVAAQSSASATEAAVGISTPNMLQYGQSAAEAAAQAQAELTQAQINARVQQENYEREQELARLFAENGLPPL